ncbi:BTAD domain-containing putative transcriptional regulator [Kouleothrix sp.]|uniref:BTAD domain-containing putative transcriptional regulator n=1 Tax=Kouleothrix sp. TaxID=2779161 RepID=UPI00391874D0
MLRLRLLGAPSLADDARELYLPSQKAQALLFYLAAESERSFSRGQIIALLWEDSSEREGRNSLSTALTRLRQALPLFPLRTEGDTLAWLATPDVWVDLHGFQAAAQPAQAGAAARRTDQLEMAAGLYRGTFLDGFSVRDSATYDEWLRLERERWQQRWLNLIDQLIEAYAQSGSWDRALVHARNAMNADPLQERFHRALMRLHYQAGDRAAALAQFRICRDVLDRELGVEPDPETTALYQAIADGTLERAGRPATAAPPARPAPSAVVPGSRLGARLASARRRSFVGRTGELATFAAALADEQPPFVVLHVYGPGGVGKSTLLSEFSRLCAEANVPAWLIDGRNVQPTPDGFLNALRETLGTDSPLEALPQRHVLLIDTYEVLTPLDSWLRDQFLPQIPEQALVVLAGRNPPAASWRVDPGWQEITQVVPLGNLSEAEAEDYLQRRNIPPEQREPVLRFTRGYPLALSLAVEVLIQRPGYSFDGTATPDIVRVLLERFVASVPSVAHRAALEACSQVRVMGEPLLAAMLGSPEARELFDWLRGLSFISAGPRGIFPHDLAREALAADLKWRNPPWHHELHRRARNFYMAEFERSRAHEQYLALLDLIYLHDNPLIRSTFTWNDIAGLVEDTPRAADWPTLIEMVRRHEGDESAALAARWFARQPEGVTVFRDGAGNVTGFNCFLALRPEDRAASEFDPCAQALWRYADTLPPLQPGQFIAIDRFWMDSEAYQGISPTQGMIFVSALRYVLTAPGLAYSFHVWKNADSWLPAASQVLFQRIPSADFPVGGHSYGVFLRDWVATPPAAWLEALAERETAS